ncbi:hypothetical protein I7822_29390, partial [Metabacillus sp. BG109]|nr:hypothetical protein [Metabacillus bambusae]
KKYYGNDNLPIRKQSLNFEPTEVSVVKTKNLFNKTTVTSGKYVSTTNGTLGDNTVLSASDYIPISPSTSYTQSHSDSASNFAFYDSSKVFISGATDTKTFSTPSNAAYVRVTIRNVNLDSYQLEVGTESTGYVPYEVNQVTGLTVEKDNVIGLESLKVPRNTVIVSKYGGFNSIVEAVASITDDSQSKPYTINVYPGIYDNETIQLRGRFIGIKAVQKGSVVIQNSYNDYARPPIDMSGDNGQLEGLIVISKQGTQTGTSPSYGVHIDDWGNGGGTTILKDCKIISENAPALGIGLRDQQTIEIIGCEIISPVRQALYAHNQQSNGGTDQKLISKNSRYESGSTNDAVLVIQDANHREGGGAGDAQDTVFSFYNNIIWSTVNGTANPLTVDAPLDANSWCGYIKLGGDSFGNNVTQINA